MKLLLKIFLLVVSLALLIPFQVDAANDVTIHYFKEETCPNCRQASIFLNELLVNYDNVNLIIYDIRESSENENLFLELVSVFDRDLASIPYMIIGGKDLQGLYEIESQIEDVIEYYQDKQGYTDVVERVINKQVVLPEDLLQIDFSENKTITLPIIGEIEIASFSLLLGAILIGAIDGFNPCAMWILIFLITMLINLKDRKRVWILGFTFIFTSGLIYYIIMMSWLQLVMKLALISAFQIAIGVLALIFAFFSLRHFWQQIRKDTGCEVTDAKSKRKLMEKIKQVIHKNNLWLAIVGIAGVAITVNIIELACSAGLPVIYTSMLAYHNLTALQSAMYILIYVLFFLIDDLIIFSIAIISFRVTGISNKYAKYSSLLGGLIMLFIGIAMIFFPHILF